MRREAAGADLRWFLAALAVALLSLTVVATVRGGGTPPSPEPAALPQQVSLNGRITLPPGREIVVRTSDGRAERITSLLAVPNRMRFGEYRWNETGVPPGPVWVRVDLSRQLVSAFRAGHEVGTAVILYGAQDHPTPTGWLKVIAKARDHYSRTYDAPMPYMLRLTSDGVALHASDVRQGRATHGCIGLPYAFAARLYDAVGVGGEVLVVGAGAA